MLPRKIFKFAAALDESAFNVTVGIFDEKGKQADVNSTHWESLRRVKCQ